MEYVEHRVQNSLKLFFNQRLVCSLCTTTVKMTSNGVPNKRILVIGAGPSGLTCIKQCRDEGFDVLCVERSEKLGGLWRYKDNHNEASVAKSTIINTSKEFSAFSDFPPPAEFPNYMHNTKMVSS